MAEEKYNPQNKFGHPEDEPAVYYDDRGNEVSEEEWLRSVRVAAGNAGVAKAPNPFSKEE